MFLKIRHRIIRENYPKYNDKFMLLQLLQINKKQKKHMRGTYKTFLRSVKYKCLFGVQF